MNNMSDNNETIFPLLIWELFSETASAARIPDGGTQPHFLVLTQTIFFYNLFSFPPAPMQIVIIP